MKDRATKKADGSSLRRGLACLSCRRRKLKCNGQKPACSHCIGRNRESECEYDDDKKKSRLQTLKEREELLRHQVNMLEMACQGNIPSSSSSSISATPSEIMSSPSGSSSTNSLPYFTPPPEYPIMGAYSSQRPSPSPLLRQPTGPAFSYQNLPNELLITLLQSFLSHQAQCCFFTYTDPRRRFSSNSLNPPHPALLGSIYLLGCHFLGPSSPHAPLTGPLLNNAVRDVLQVVGSPRPPVDVVQACCLIGQYYYFTGDKVQGYRHAFAAARMATTLGLHQLKREQDAWAVESELFGSEGGGGGPWADERADEIAAFWQVFTVDRMWSAAYGLVAALPDESSPSRRITTPFPATSGWVNYDECTLLCYPMGKTPSFVDLMMSADMHFPVVPTPSMLKSMAAALFDRTSRVRASQFNDGTDFLNHQSATIMLQRLRSIVPPFAGRPAWAASPPFLDMDLFTVYTILHTCTMQVCPSQRGGPGDGAFGQCALDGLLAMMDQLDEADYAFLDPVVTICWSKAANHLLKSLRTFDALTASTSIQQIRGSIERLQHGVRRMSLYHPNAGELERTLQKEIQLEFGFEFNAPVAAPIPISYSYILDTANLFL